MLILNDTDTNIDLNAVDKYNNTALILAAFHGHTPIVRALLADQRVNPNLVNVSGLSPLVVAIRSGYVGTVAQLLADERTDPNSVNQDGYTAVGEAMMHYN